MGSGGLTRWAKSQWSRENRGTYYKNDGSFTDNITKLCVCVNRYSLGAGVHLGNPSALAPSSCSVLLVEVGRMWGRCDVTWHPFAALPLISDSFIADVLRAPGTSCRTIHSLLTLGTVPLVVLSRGRRQSWDGYVRQPAHSLILWQPGVICYENVSRGSHFAYRTPGTIYQILDCIYIWKTLPSY